MTRATPFFALTLREWRRMLRQPSRLISTLATAAIFWLFLAAGFSTPATDAIAGTDYARYLIPGVALMAVMFTAVIGAITLIQDRQSGFLQSALTSPAPMAAIAGSKITAIAALATAQGALILAASFAVTPNNTPAPTLPGFITAVAALALVALTVCAVSLALAWRMNSIAGFHGVMNIVLLPAWALSGALFPPETAATPMTILMTANPVAWAHQAITDALNIREAPLPWALYATAAFTAIATALALASMRRTRRSASRAGER